MFEMHSKHFVLNELRAELCSCYFVFVSLELKVKQHHSQKKKKKHGSCALPLTFDEMRDSEVHAEGDGDEQRSHPHRTVPTSSKVTNVQRYLRLKLLSSTELHAQVFY